MNVKKECMKIIKGHLNLDEVELSNITDNSSLSEIGADSLDVIEIVIGIEDKLDIQIDDSALDNIGKLLSYVEGIYNAK